MNYKSPIEAFYSDVQLKFEDGVYKAVQAVDIHVDRDELIKALQYDRQQYEKGWHDALLKVQEEHSVCTKENCPVNANTLSDDCNVTTCPWRTEAFTPKVSMSGLWYECPACGRHLTKDIDHYCARCGRRMKWE